MREGRSRADWDVASMLIANMRLVAGSKKEDSRTYHPFYAAQIKQAQRKTYKTLVRQQVKRQAERGS